MATYRKRPVEIEAIMWTGFNFDEVLAFGEGKVNSLEDRNLLVDTEEGQLAASPGDWIIKGVEGEFYPCKPSVFAKTYEQV